MLFAKQVYQNRYHKSLLGYHRVFGTIKEWDISNNYGLSGAPKNLRYVCFQKVLDKSGVKIGEGSGPKYLLSIR